MSSSTMCIWVKILAKITITNYFESCEQFVGCTQFWNKTVYYSFVLDLARFASITARSRHPIGRLALAGLSR